MSVFRLQCPPPSIPTWPPTNQRQLAGLHSAGHLGCLESSSCDSHSGWAWGRIQAYLAFMVEEGLLRSYTSQPKPHPWGGGLPGGTDRLRRRPVRKASRLRNTKVKPCICLLAQPLVLYPWGLAGLLGIPGMRMCVPGQEEVSGWDGVLSLPPWALSGSGGEQLTLRQGSRVCVVATYSLCSSFVLSSLLPSLFSPILK